MKRWIKSILRHRGYEVHHFESRYIAPGSVARPIGEMQSFLEDIKARNFLPNAVLDVGAHRAEWSHLCAGIFPEAAYILVEPLTEMQQYLLPFVQARSNRWHFPVAAGARSTKLAFTTPTDLTGSTLLPRENAEALADGSQRIVPVETLDDIVHRAPCATPTLLKFDIQGFELEALKGASKILNSAEILIVEISLHRFYDNIPSSAEIIGFLSALGFSLYDVAGYQRRPYDGAVGAIDLVFVHDRSALRASRSWF